MDLPSTRSTCFSEHGDVRTIPILLSGTAEEPLAEGHLLVQCQARWKTIQKIPVKNTSGTDATYAVATDLSMFSGHDEIIVPANGQLDYDLHVSTQQGGNFTGSITLQMWPAASTRYR